MRWQDDMTTTWEYKIPGKKAVRGDQVMGVQNLRRILRESMGHLSSQFKVSGKQCGFEFSNTEILSL